MHKHGRLISTLPVGRHSGGNDARVRSENGPKPPSRLPSPKLAPIGVRSATPRTVRHGAQPSSRPGDRPRTRPGDAQGRPPRVAPLARRQARYPRGELNVSAERRPPRAGPDQGASRRGHSPASAVGYTHAVHLHHGPLESRMRPSILTASGTRSSRPLGGFRFSSGSTEAAGERPSSD